MSRPIKRRKVSLPAPKVPVAAPPTEDFEAGSSSSSGEEADDWDVEAAYARRVQKIRQPENTRLPIKTAEGWKVQDLPVNQGSDTSEVLGDSDEDGEELSDTSETQEAEEPTLTPREQINKAKEEIAKLAGLIVEDPETNIGLLKDLAAIAESPNSTVRKLALVSQCAVYRDIIPGYRIRPLSETDMKEKLSKDVKKMRTYEQNLVRSYQQYIQLLDKLTAKRQSNDTIGVYSVALSCATTLLTERPHFNFRSDIVQIIIRRLSINKIDADFSKCTSAIEQLFRDDDEGHASLDIVSSTTKMMKTKNYNVNEAVLNTFLHLRLLSEFNGTGSQNKIDKPAGDDARPLGKNRDNKKVFRNKKEKKHLRELKKVEKEMKEADATVGKEENERMQSEMLKMVFATYFRILKARSPRLMGATLEGLARYAHLINQDFFGDILESLKDLLRASERGDEGDEEAGLVGEGGDNEAEDGETAIDSEDAETSRDLLRESLLCIITAFALLQGQDGRAAFSTLHLDLEFFITKLYASLYPAAMDADIELSNSSLHLEDPNNDAEQGIRLKSRVNVKTTTVLLIRSLSSVLLPTHAIRSIPPLRLAAFTKQLHIAALQLPEKSCLALLSLLEQVTKVHGRKIAALWNSEERKGDGRFEPLKKEVEGCNPFAATIWEGELLRCHFAPKVRELYKGVLSNIRNS